jgi:iron complex outermembrane receptor protein
MKTLLRPKRWFGLIALPGLLVGPGLQAQTTERVEITGSAVRRIDAETALPVQVIRHDEIVRTGATSVVDLLQRLPAMQGGVPETAAVGLASFGYSSAALHNLGDRRTLVLLNGRRIAGFGGQSVLGELSAVDLNSLPLAAIDRIEVLSDGASALYGSDAIAGVVNVITRRRGTAGELTLGSSLPRDGAREQRIDLSQGFGDFDADGHNLMLSFSADRRDALKATDRRFARSGVINFSANGQRYQFFNGAANGIPANIYDPSTNAFFNPGLLHGGHCSANHVALDGACYYDYASQSEIVPERERQNLLASFTQRLNADHTLFTDVLLARSTSVSRIGAVPGVLRINPGTPLHNQYVLPEGIPGPVDAYYRLSDLGGRQDDASSNLLHAVVGVEGRMGEWDYNTAFTHSRSRARMDIRGYPGGLAVQRLLDSGAIDPFLDPGQQSAAGRAGLAAVNYDGYWNGGDSTLDSLELRGSRELLPLAGGPMVLATGASLSRERFTAKPSAFAQGLLSDPVTGAGCTAANASPCDLRFGDAGPIPAYSAGRTIWGLFGELSAPLRRDLELTASARHDHYQAVGGNTSGKLAFRFNATPGALLRGSVGTGFRAPSVAQINGSLQAYSATQNAYNCTPELLALATSLGTQCQPNGTQYNVFASGNQQLRPEHSRQATLGLHLEPSRSWSVGADLWVVAISDAFGQVSEQAAFADPATFASSFMASRDPVTGANQLAFYAPTRNLGKSITSGIDLDVDTRLATPLGRLNSRLLGTWLLRDAAQLQPGGPYYSALGQYSPLPNSVSFRWQGRWLNTLQSGDWSHTLGMNFKSGYRDVDTTVEVLGPNDSSTGNFENIRLKVKPFYTFDWQTRWQATRALAVTAGVLNLFDREPPLSLAVSGQTKGFMVGYDDRYYDARGRTLYLNASYGF